jgi:DNA-binding transcriptional MerR regulator
MNVPEARHRARTYSLDELCTLSELPRRTVRYYIQVGLVDRPEGETRAAKYFARHLEQLLQIRKWTDAGVSLERIRELLAGGSPAVPPRPRGPGAVEVWSHLVLTDGVELIIEPTRSGLSSEQAREFFRGASALYSSIKNKE